ncbi:MAG: hypothetical protein LBT40_15485 [Deltaproteobacteria bacterium]|nr:hypothetical protein [Deltaproteobacteria bacterium]
MNPVDREGEDVSGSWRTGRWRSARDCGGPAGDDGQGIRRIDGAMLGILADREGEECP